MGDVGSVPAGWDAHVHVFDAQAPVLAGHYRPVHRTLATIEALAAEHGFGHLVLVQPSVYGTDNRVMERALLASGGRHRGVAVVDAAVTDAELDRLHAAGVRGVRFNLVSPVGNGPRDLPALAPRLAARGWHVQWYARPRELEAIARWHGPGAPVAVLDHLAGLHADLPATDPAWESLRRLAGQGAWIKLSGWYRLGDAEPYGRLEAPLRRAAECFGERVVWGSDWPHTAFAPEATPGYASVWSPVVRVLGAEAAGRVARQAERLYG